MKVCRLLKKFRNLDPTEERVMAHALRDGEQALEVVVKYHAKEIDTIDKVLDDTDKLYTQHGDNNLRVACLLARRETYMKLLLLLTEKIELDVDQTKD